MRICIVTGTFPPEIGGPPTYLAQLIPALSSRGHSIHVVTYGENQVSDLPCTIERVSRVPSIPRRLLSFTSAVVRGSAAADLLFVSDYGLPPALVNQMRRLPLVIKVVGDFAWEYATRHQHIPAKMDIDAFQSIQPTPRVTLLKLLQRGYVSAADRVIVPSNYLRSIVTGWGIPSERVEVVYNAVPLPGQQATLDFSDRMILTVARLAPWKGIDTLIESIASLSSTPGSPRLVVAGDGEDRERLEALADRLAPGRVTFTGAVEKHAIASLMHEASALALASAYEGLSHVLLEGMAHGLPIIASNIAGNRELIQNNSNGWLVEVGDVQGFASAISECLGDMKTAHAYGRVNRAWATEHSVDHQVERTLEVCFEAVRNRRN